MAHNADVFISYSREDKEVVLSLAEQLRSHGVSLWIDQGSIDGATMWGEEIVTALENAKVLLLMVSERSVNSHNVVKEVVLASERKEHILPVHLEPTRIPVGLKYPLAGIQHIEYFQGDKAENLKTIIRSLERIGVLTTQSVTSHVSVSTSPSHSMHSQATAIELERAIAVLPFSNISSDQDTDYFSDGLTEELITSLSRLKDIRVVPGTTTMIYKGTTKSIRAVAEELRARYVITGSVRKHQDNVRIAAQLIDAQTEAQQWAETYKGKLDDIFEIQENVAKQIVEALSIKLTTVQEIALTKRSTDNPEALDYYMRGREFRYKSRGKNLEFAIELFQKAIELDTRYANAYAGLSESYSLLYEFYGKNPSELSRCIEASLKAIMYDPSSAEAHAALGLSYFYQGHLEDAVQACLKAIELDPNLFIGYRNLGRIYHLSDRDIEAVDMLKKSIELKPDDYAMLSVLGSILSRLGREKDKDAVQKRLLELMPRYLLREPEDVIARAMFAITLAWASRVDEALFHARLVLETESTDGNTLYNIACVFSQLNDLQGAVDGLRNAINAGFVNYEWIKRDSDLDPIRNDPDYIELMKGR